jgi:hypothetical protein
MEFSLQVRREFRCAKRSSCGFRGVDTERIQNRQFSLKERCRDQVNYGGADPTFQGMLPWPGSCSLLHRFLDPFLFELTWKLSRATG